MPKEDWSPERLREAIARLEQENVKRSELQRMAGKDQTTVGRWARGERQPMYPNIRDLAWGIWRRYPRLRPVARELVEASGYPWGEPPPSDAQPPLIDPRVEADIRRLAESPEEAEALLAAMRERRMANLRRTDGKPAA